eukprot:TRINITY_DN18300_c0_g1_i1.p2 TRINITY_DN18300_c0_g1~~TRINITY_DN18300_c0_g1_i1.p2  ORF type:complete len:118 (+),score=2.41 TRINITY_DN18300_c0_g1_i1:287-640(+)
MNIEFVLSDKISLSNAISKHGDLCWKYVDQVCILCLTTITLIILQKKYGFLQICNLEKLKIEKKNIYIYILQTTDIFLVSIQIEFIFFQIVLLCVSQRKHILMILIFSTCVVFFFPW